MKTAIIVITSLIILLYIVSLIAAAYIRSDEMLILKVSKNIPTTPSVILGVSKLLSIVLVGVDIILALILII